jgi:hypothetical protein
MSFRLLPNNITIKTEIPIILPLVLYGSKMWSLILWGELRRKVTEDKVLKIYGLKKDEIAGDWIKRTIRSLVECTLRQTIT